MTKILIEGNNLFGNKTGIGQFTKSLLENLFILDKNNKYEIFAFVFIKKRLTLPFPSSENVRFKIVRFFPARIYRRLMRKGLAPNIETILMTKGDIVIYPNFVSYPSSKKSKRLLFVYDVSYITHAHFSHKLNAEYLTEWVPKSIASADRIITISKNAKQEIIDNYGVDRKLVQVINPAVDHKLFTVQSPKVICYIKNKYKIKKDYILYAGTIEPRKNIVGVLQAYEKLPISIKARYSLVLAGGKGWNDEEIYAQIDRLKSAGEDIIQTGYVDDSDRPGIYSGAALFVFPSFYEGFGMPPLEAMACGVPVITSDNSSLPEAVGNAALKVKAEDTIELSHQMKRVLSDEKLAVDLRKKGIIQANKFTWERSAKKLMKIIEDISS